MEKRNVAISIPDYESWGGFGFIKNWRGVYIQRATTNNQAGAVNRVGCVGWIAGWLVQHCRPEVLPPAAPPAAFDHEATIRMVVAVSEAMRIRADQQAMDGLRHGVPQPPAGAQLDDHHRRAQRVLEGCARLNHTEAPHMRAARDDNKYRRDNRVYLSPVEGLVVVLPREPQYEVFCPFRLFFEERSGTWAIRTDIIGAPQIRARHLMTIHAITFAVPSVLHQPTSDPTNSTNRISGARLVVGCWLGWLGEGPDWAAPSHVGRRWVPKLNQDSATRRRPAVRWHPIFILQAQNMRKTLCGVHSLVKAAQASQLVLLRSSDVRSVTFRVTCAS
jgi:hypothetical protein